MFQTDTKNGVVKNLVEVIEFVCVCVCVYIYIYIYIYICNLLNGSPICASTTYKADEISVGHLIFVESQYKIQIFIFNSMRRFSCLDNEPYLVTAFTFERLSIV
jgi:hypothetical protein